MLLGSSLDRLVISSRAGETLLWGALLMSFSVSFRGLSVGLCGRKRIIAYSMVLELRVIVPTLGFMSFWGSGLLFSWISLRTSDLISGMEGFSLLVFYSCFSPFCCFFAFVFCFTSLVIPLLVVVGLLFLLI